METIHVEGVLDIDLQRGGNGQLLDLARGGKRRPSDPFIPKELIRRFKLRTGSMIGGTAFPPDGRFPNPKMRFIETVDGVPLEDRRARYEFTSLTTISPNQHLKMEMKDGRMTTRAVDLFCPIGKGTRGLIVAPSAPALTHLVYGALVQAGRPGMCLAPESLDDVPRRDDRAARAVAVFDVLVGPLADRADLLDAEAEIQQRLSELAAQIERSLDDPRFVGVGEIGLDFFIPALTEPDLRAKQETFYKAQLDLAERYGLPVVLHVRRSHDILLKHLRTRPPIGGIAHAFNGSFQQAQQFIDLGFVLGFGGAMTYTRRAAAEPPRHLLTATRLANIRSGWNGPPVLPLPESGPRRHRPTHPRRAPWCRRC